jgi:hypothetical protein
VFGEGADDDDSDSDLDDSTSEPLSSSAIEESGDINDSENSDSHDEESSNGSDNDGHSDAGSQGVSGQVSYEIFVDASFNHLGTSVRRALHGEYLIKLKPACATVLSHCSLIIFSAAPMFSRCVRVFELSSVDRSRVVLSAQPAVSEFASGQHAPAFSASL